MLLNKEIIHLLEEKKVPIITFGDLMDEYQIEEIEYLKIDIERSTFDVCSSFFLFIYIER